MKTCLRIADLGELSGTESYKKGLGREKIFAQLICIVWPVLLLSVGCIEAALKYRVSVGEMLCQRQLREAGSHVLVKRSRGRRHPN